MVLEFFSLAIKTVYAFVVGAQIIMTIARKGAGIRERICELRYQRAIICFPCWKTVCFEKSIALVALKKLME